MTTTPEKMTLERVQYICLQWVYATAGNRSLCAAAEARIKEVFAELVKQRNAEPVAWMRIHEMGVDLRQADPSPFLPGNWRPLYTHPRQRNAAEVTDEMVEIAYNTCDRFIDENADGDVSNLDDGEWNEMLRAALSAVASRDREDAERYRWLCEYAEDAVVYNGGEPLLIVPIQDAAIDAARQKNKP